MKMTIKVEPRKNYEFYNPSDTKEILFGEILKKGKWSFDERSRREKKEDWWYECKSDFAKNINLLFNKFIPVSLVNNEDKDNKDKYLRLVSKEFATLTKQLDNFDFVKERIRDLIETLENIGYIKASFQFTCPWRLIIGFGASHPQETSMMLHHIYGIPYIPASALKGITKHWAVLECAEKKAKKDKKEFREAVLDVSKALEEGIDLDIEIYNIRFKDIIESFGTQKQSGKVIFMDAYPVGDVNLKVDIVNPHYIEYYSGMEPPADWQNPSPIKFLVIEKTKFQFYLISTSKALLNHTEKLLKLALKEHGIGAKTTLGYGLFEEVETCLRALDVDHN